jgi:hypothetical protein
VPRVRRDVRTPPAAPFNSTTHIMDGYALHHVGKALTCADSLASFHHAWDTFESEDHADYLLPAK